MHVTSKAAFGTVKIHIDPRHCVWGCSVLYFKLFLWKEDVISVYMAREKTFSFHCPESILCAVSYVVKWHRSIGMVKVESTSSMHLG